jgi:hypothetical protein
MMSKKTKAQWVDKIADAWARRVTGFVETGKVLFAAKKDLTVGEWLHLVNNDLQLEPKTARCLMAIAAHPIISNPQYASFLPAEWEVLYELSKIDADTLREFLEHGEVSPRTERKDARVLRRSVEDDVSIDEPGGNE